MGAADIRHDQRFCHQIRQAVYRIDARLYRIENHRGVVDRKGASKDSERPEEALLVLAQQAVTPIDDGPHCPMPEHRRAALRPQQRQAIKAGRESCDAKHFDTGCGELDRQWQTVKPPAYLDDRLGIRIGQRKIFDNRGGTLDEQLHRRKGRRLGGRQS